MAATGDHAAQENLIKLWGKLGRVEELRKLAIDGNADAQRQLVQLLDPIERQEQLKKMAAAGDLWASSLLPRTNYSTEFTDLA